jgi:hypothetical protein
MISGENSMHKWNDDRWSGILLIVTALTGVVVMAHHPTGRGVLEAGNPAAMVRLNRIVHGVAIAAMPVQLLGLMGLHRRLGGSLLSQAALVAQGFGLVAGMGAAVASGLVGSAILEAGLAQGPSAPHDPLLHYSGLWNQGFAQIYVAATGLSFLLWSLELIRRPGLPKGAGVLGLLAGAATFLWVISGQRHLGVHEFGLIVLAGAVWLVWIGIWLLRSAQARAAA